MKGNLEQHNRKRMREKRLKALKGLKPILEVKPFLRSSSVFAFCKKEGLSFDGTIEMFSFKKKYC